MDVVVLCVCVGRQMCKNGIVCHLLASLTYPVKEAAEEDEKEDAGKDEL